MNHNLGQKIVKGINTKSFLDTWHSTFGPPVAWLPEPFWPVSYSLMSELIFPTSLHHVLLCMAFCSMHFGSGCCRVVPAASPTALVEQEMLSSYLVSFLLLFSHLPGNMVFLIYTVYSKDFLYTGF